MTTGQDKQNDAQSLVDTSTGTRLYFALIVLCLLSIGATYGTCLSATVQGMDTGELVSHAYAWQVAHPPGFPAFMWLTHYLCTALPFKTVFWRASMGSCLCALVTLAVIACSGGLVRTRWQRQVGALGALVVPLAFERLFWQYSINPDVFALHAASTAVVLGAFLCMQKGTSRALCTSVAVGVGLANHPSSIFLTPLWICALWDMPSRKRACGLCAATIFGVASLYLSLCSMNPYALDSWGTVDSMTRVAWHASRVDYGTWQLDGHARAARPLANLTLLLRHLCTAMPFTCMLSTMSLVAQRRDPRLRLCVGTLCVYCLVFFSLANTGDVRILERFIIMPEVGFVLLGAYAFCRAPSKSPRRIEYLLVLAQVLATTLTFRDNLIRNDLSQDTVIEDYALNMLRMPSDTEMSVIVTDDDTRYNALRYVQNVLAYRSDTMVLTLGTALSDAGVKKRAVRYPDFKVAEPAAGQEQSFVQRIMLPNRDAYTFFFTPRVNFSGFHTRYLGLGRAIKAAAQMEVDKDSWAKLKWRSRPVDDDAIAKEAISRFMYLEYCDYHLASVHFAKSTQARQDALRFGYAQHPECRDMLLSACERYFEQALCRQQF